MLEIFMTNIFQTEKNQWEQSSCFTFLQVSLMSDLIEATEFSYLCIPVLYYHTTGNCWKTPLNTHEGMIVNKARNGSVLLWTYFWSYIPSAEVLGTLGSPWAMLSGSPPQSLALTHSALSSHSGACVVCSQRAGFIIFFPGHPENVCNLAVTWYWAHSSDLINADVVWVGDYSVLVQGSEGSDRLRAWTLQPLRLS